MNLGFFKRRDTIQFSGRRHTQLGILSAVIGLAVVAGFIAVSIISGINKGQAGIIIGVVGLLLFALSITGFVFSYRAIKQRDIYYRFPMIGLISNGIMMIVLMILYIIGIVV
ncbi:DUF6142 family protein [Herbinix luporum]|jgi:uncharacterized membrane protein YidH (DUF202 family)|uniref:Putative membrane protein n=1 Tax=Herbinix luporum TaxID=1679721 RepID=A0A0K8J3L7_9FIRM|nr:DUF6142 family protein [Herbinix luporum]MDI9488946.1 DUF6142 family protein [Bacillota bacterium]CUH91954.1 putative membrane protein [Herbinix luporum]HHT56258.1 hypothetical protein [Herbinix luporum]